MSSYPIGFFDSGIGGITLWKKITSILPNENTIYISDKKNCPYGEKSKKEIEEISIYNSRFLIDRNCKIIVVACNTATTNSISKLRSKFKVPFIGIEPAIKPAALNSKTKKVGVLATKGTLTSNLFFKTSSNQIADVELINTYGEGLIELIEKGDCENELNVLLKKYLIPMIDYGIDQLVLGCTHYPLIKDSIKNIVGEGINVVDCNDAVAMQTKRILELNNLMHNNTLDLPNHCFFNSGEDDISIKEILQNNYEIFKFE